MNGVLRTAFELHGLRSAFREEACGVAKRLLGADLPTHEGHVADDVSAARTTSDGAAVIDHLVDRHRQGGVLSLHDHAEGVSD